MTHAHELGMRRTARVAGLIYLLLGAASFGGFLGLPLVTGDADAVARLILSDPLRFRIGILCDVLTGVLAILLVVALFRLLQHVSRTLAIAMVILLGVASPIGFAITFADLAAEGLLVGEGPIASLAETDRTALAYLFLRVHRDGVFAMEIFWGLWLLPFGLLVLKSDYFPRFLGVLLLAAGVAYVAHSIISLLLPGQRFAWYEYATMAARAAGEFPILLYLIFVGIRAGADPADTRASEARASSSGRQLG